MFKYGLNISSNKIKFTIYGDLKQVRRIKYIPNKCIQSIDKTNFINKRINNKNIEEIYYNINKSKYIRILGY